MRDKVSEQRIAELHPEVRQLFKEFIEEAEEALGITLRITQGLRTIAYQNGLYAQGRTKPGKIVTKAKGGQSYHNYGLAVDLVPLTNGKPDWNYAYEKLLPFAQKRGLIWGGNFSGLVDKPHFEYSTGNHWRKLFERYSRKDFVPGTEYVRLDKAA